MFAVHIFATYFTFWNIYYLSLQLYQNRTSAFLSVVAFILPHFTFAGLVLIEFSLVNRTFVLPFLLLAINLYFQRKHAWSFLLLGALYNLHVVSVNFVLAMLVLDSLLVRYKNKLTLLANFVLFVIGALPILLWKFGQSSLDLSVRPEWFHLVVDGALGHLFRYFLLQPPIIILTLSGVGMVIIFFQSQRYFSSRYQRSLNLMMITTIIIVLTDWASTSFYPVTIIVQSQIIRAGLFTMIFAYLQLIASLVFLSKQKRISAFDFLFFFITVTISQLSLFVIAMGTMIRQHGKNTLKYSLLGLIVVTNAVVLLLAIQSKLWDPHVQIYPPRTDQYLVQVWAKNHTPKGAIFIVPPYLWGFYDLDWRVISERTPVVTWSELLEIAFTPEYLSYWKSRFADVAPFAISQFHGNALANIDTTRRTFNSLSQDQLEAIGRKYHASYLVAERTRPYRLPIVYQNNRFIIYRLPSD